MRMLERACDTAQQNYYHPQQKRRGDRYDKEGENFTNAAQTDWLLFPSFIYDNILSCTPRQQ